MIYKFEDPDRPAYRGNSYTCKRSHLAVTFIRQLNGKSLEFTIPLTKWLEVQRLVPVEGLEGDECRWKSSSQEMWVFRREVKGHKHPYYVRIIAYARSTSIDVSVPKQVWNDILDFMSLVPEEEKLDKMQLILNSKENE